MSSSTEPAEREAASAPREPERLAYDDAVHDVATTRRVAMGAIVVSAALLAALAQSLWAYVVAALALVAARFWARRIAMAKEEERVLTGRALVLDEDGVSIPNQDGSTTSVAWSSLERVEIDHERLVVVLRLEDARELDVEPSYGGLGLDALARRIEAARPAAVDPTEPHPAALH